MNNPRIILVAGRSGGHILPALTLANQYKKNTPSAEIFFISTATPLDFSLLKTHPLITKHIPFNLGNIPSRIIHYPLYIAQLCKFFIKSLFILKKTTPEKIISTGGYVALPVCIAAWFLRIPVELYELNAVPGKTIELLARFATTTFTPFTSAQKKLARYNCTINPYPLKFTESDKISQKKALESLTLSQDKKTLLIVGGSQGSSFINEAIRTWLQEDESLHHKLQIIHQTGSNAIDDYQLFYHKKKIPAHVFDYHDNLARYYNAADLVICRAGAGTLFEIMFFQKPCIIIPLETTTTAHQRDNALALAQQYPTLVTILDQQHVTKNRMILDHAIKRILANNTNGIQSGQSSGLLPKPIT